MYKKRIKSAMAIALTVSMTVPGALPAGNGTWKMLDSFAAEDDANKATPGNATPSNVTWGSGDSAQKLNILQNFGEDEPTIIASSKPILRARKNKDGKWEVVEVMDKNSARGARVGEEDEEEYAFFKDSDGDGELDVYEDWTKSSEERAADLARQMAEHDVRDLVGMMVINSRGMGINQKDKTKVDSTGLLDEAANVGSSNVEDVFGGQGSGTYGTTDTIKTLRMRHFILRQNPEPEDMAAWINQMNIVAEDTTWGIPVLVDSNSRNENGQMTFGMNDASGVFSTWPGTLGLAAAAKGDGNVDIITQFANIAREEWDASGLKKGYMYMVDTMTDPRWQRTYGTFGEDQDLIAQIAEELVKGFQGGSDGVQTNGVALTMKHFPGGGARENGFDPHYKAGQWNVYQTEDSLEKYHLPGFKAAIDNKVSSIMPYYAKPSELKSSVQHDENGNVMPMQPVGFAFNRYFIQSLLRDQLGHEGYVNSDSGIIGNMCWGVEELDTPERAAFAINAGTDIISDTNDVWSIMEAYNRGEDGDPSTKAYHYYEDSKNTPPYGYTKEQVTLTKEKLIESNERLLKEMFDLGLFENPYRDPDNAKMVVDNQENWDAAYLGHQKSVVMLKNVDSVLPLTEEKLEGKKVYVEYFAQSGADAVTPGLRDLVNSEYGMELTDNYEEADYALLFVNPTSGNYFVATQGYLELDICEDKDVPDVDDQCRPMATTHKETTLKDAAKIAEISKAVRANGGKVITNVNFTLAWLLGNVEPYADALLAGFDTLTKATLDVIVGNYDPTGKMPITLPRNDAVIEVNADGVCVSPNDVPGYAKDQYMPASLKDSNGKAYAYRDSVGNYYELNFGLSFDDDYSDPLNREFKVEANGANEPSIGARPENIIEVDGKHFKDSNKNGELDKYEDWRLSSEERAKDLVEKMTVEDKIGMMVINSRGMGINQRDKSKVDATGLLDEAMSVSSSNVENVFGGQGQGTYGTTDTIKKLRMRHFILRQNPEPEDLAAWINQMNLVAEDTELGIPVLVDSNSRNENGQMTFGMNDASGVFSTWPGTLGLAAAVKGDKAKGGDASLISNFAEIARSEWDASGIKKGYMYMVDTMTDPRWQRTYGTFGEDPELIADIAARLVVGFQGSSEGVQPNGVALTMKHFPGGGARENGFDPHYAAGQWNVYQTEDSLRKYHLPGFQAAIDNNVSSIMPYYAKPNEVKSSKQYDKNGDEIPMQAVGFAFNRFFIQNLLRDQMGHKGYVNSDSGIIGNMCWGVDELDVPERAAYAINAGTDIISDTNDVWSIKIAYDRATNGYYDDPAHAPAYNFTKEQVTLTDEALNRSNERLLKEMFDLGLFENPYRDPNNAKAVVDTEENWAAAYEAHQKSVVLLKNDDVLPLTAEKLEGKKVYVEYFAQSGADDVTPELRSMLADKYGLTLTSNYGEADYALLFVNPTSGNYFTATQGYLELDICEDKVVPDVDDQCRPMTTTHKETTLERADKIAKISQTVRGNGGKVITNVNFTLAWLLGNVEPYSDALLAGFDTYTEATMDVIVGTYEPTGKMPITLPKDDSVIAVNADGVCISPNDVPGYLKDEYMPESMKDENGKAYAYRDSEGNYYEMNFGLDYSTKTPVQPPHRPSGGGGGSSSSGSSRRTSGEWVQDATGWWYKNADGTWPAGAWVQLTWNGVSSWYRFNDAGYMVAGWFLDADGNWYFLHNASDGTQGYMYTGWHQINGAWYYFRENAGGPLGSLVVSGQTPDGYQVDANGAWIQ